jgi:hypothetical protein
MRNLLVFLALSFLVSCRFGWGEKVSGNGHIKTEERQVSDFNSVDVSGDIAVHVKQDMATGVRLETDENLMQYIEVFISDSKLVIRTKEGYNLDASKDIIAYVSAPVFKNIEVSGTCDVVGDGLIGGNTNLDIHVSGSGSVDMEVDMAKVTTHMSGSGNIKLRGEADDFDASVSGSGDINCFDLHTENTELNLSGSSSAEVNASKKLDVDVSGSADVKYKGSPAVNQSVSGSGSVKKVD